MTDPVEQAFIQFSCIRDSTIRLTETIDITKAIIAGAAFQFVQFPIENSKLMSLDKNITIAISHPAKLLQLTKKTINSNQLAQIIPRLAFL